MDKTNPHYEEGMGRQFLIKWGNTPYNDCSYEFERDLILNEIEYKEPVKDFLLRSKKPKANESRRRSRENEEERRKLNTIFSAKSSLSESQQEKAVEKFQRELQDNVYKNGGQVRDYQAEGISWMLSNYVNQRSSILADEVCRFFLNKYNSIAAHSLTASFLSSKDGSREDPPNCRDCQHYGDTP
jgi:hypothetical protein